MKIIKFTIPVVILISCSVLIFGFKVNANSKNTSLPKNNNSVANSETKNTIERVMEYLETNVPEIKEFGQNIYKSSQGETTLIMRLDAVPDENSNDEYHDYYCVYVGENHSDYTVRWHTFYVSKDLNDILVDDVITGEVVSLNQWREAEEDLDCDQE